MPVNRRSSLRSEYQARLAYPGYCMTLMPIVIPVSTLVAIGDKHLCLKSDHANLKRFALLEVARIIEEEYRIQKNSKHKSVSMRE